jgi:hypothetical protein
LGSCHDRRATLPEARNLLEGISELEDAQVIPGTAYDLDPYGQSLLCETAGHRDSGQPCNHHVVTIRSICSIHAAIVSLADNSRPRMRRANSAASRKLNSEFGIENLELCFRRSFSLSKSLHNSLFLILFVMVVRMAMS